MNGFFSLLDYRYRNLCTKAEPASLIPVQVEVQNAVFNLEIIADCAVTEWNQITVIPKDEEYTPFIAKGVMEVHPEFKQEITRQYYEQIGADLKVLLLTMPPVDKKYRDTLNIATDSLYEQCVLCLDNAKMEAGLDITERLAESGKDDIDEARKRLADLDKQYRDQVKELHETKKKEIDEAYEKYLKEHGEESPATHSDSHSDFSDTSEQTDAAFSMELPK